MFEKSTSDARPDSPDELAHRCVSGPGRCLGTELDNRGEKHAARTGADGRLCDRCAEQVARVIEHLVDDWDALELLMGEHDTTQGVRVSYTTTPGIPLNTTAESNQAELLELVDIAAEMISAAGGDDYDPPRKGRYRIEYAAKLIAANIGTLLGCPADWAIRWDRSGEVHGEQPTEWIKKAPKTYVPVDRDGNELNGKGRRFIMLSGVDICMELWRLHGSVRGHYGARPQDRRKRYPMPCHGCGRKTLYRKYGEDLIKCSHCPPRSEPGRGWTEDDYNKLAANTKFHLRVVQEDEMRELDEAKQAAAAAIEKATELEDKLMRVAQFAGHETIDQLMDVVAPADQPEVSVAQG